VQRLRELGWTEGRTVAIEYRWAEGRSERYAEIAAEFVRLKVDVIVTSGGAVSAVKQATTAIPIVFAVANNAVEIGLVASLARPGGNVTGFLAFEYGLSGKWLELLKQIAPHVMRAAVFRDPAIASGIGQFGAIQAVAPSVGIEVSPVNVRDAGEIERAVTTFAGSSNGGLIVTSSGSAAVHRDLIITQAARHKLPAVYWDRAFVAAGGLISYGPDFIDRFRRAASYVDRILKGEKPADLPVQAPTKYETVLNLKTAKALGLDVPASVLTRADEVIE
jgi:putative ABC transport system substrate-binding protein